MIKKRELLKKWLEALRIGYDSAATEAVRFHAAMAGHKEKEHQQMDEEVAQIKAAIDEIEAELAKPEADNDIITRSIQKALIEIGIVASDLRKAGDSIKFQKLQSAWQALRLALNCISEPAIKKSFALVADAKPETFGMTVLDINDDDALRFVQRVLESESTEADRSAARNMIVGIRTRARNTELAKPEPDPVGQVGGC
jgi:hypothetical protein